MATYSSLNDRTLHWIEQQVVANEDDLQVKTHVLQNGARVIDFGCNVSGGIEAGLALSKICMGLSANVQLTAADRAIWNGPQLLVSTDSPLKACMASQYAGWKISHGKYFAMGSGPMRAKRGKEAVLDRFVIGDHSKSAIGVLESDELPTDEITEQIASECNVQTSKLVLCVASTSSIAGVMQVVARSIETSLHKLFELDFDLNQIRSGVGSAPIPPVAKDFATGIGRTNDAILYGGHVTLWVDAPDDQLVTLGPKVPSNSSRDCGQPFAKTFKAYGYDFYKVDPGLFAPAVLTMINLRTGKSFRFGHFSPDVLQESFGESNVLPS